MVLDCKGKRASCPDTTLHLFLILCTFLSDHKLSHEKGNTYQNLAVALILQKLMNKKPLNLSKPIQKLPTTLLWKQTKKHLLVNRKSNYLKSLAISKLLGH